MSAASYTGTTASPPRGHAFVQGQPCTVEPAGGLTCVVRVQAGAPIERLEVDSADEPVSGSTWRQYHEGDEFTVDSGRRVLLRPRGIGGGGVTFTWSGDRLAVLRNYTGAKGSTAG